MGTSTSVGNTWVQFHVLVFACCVIQGKELCLSEPQFPNLENGDNEHLLGLLLVISEMNHNWTWRIADTNYFYLYGSSHVAECL